MRALALLLVAACYRPHLDCAVGCAANGACPSDWTCAADGYCHQAPDEPSCDAIVPSNDAPLGAPDGAPGAPDAPDGGPGAPDGAPGAPDAAPGAPDAGGCTVRSIQLLANPGFEQQHTVWTESPMDLVIVPDQLGGTEPDFGAYIAQLPASGWIGGTSIEQTVTVPADATALELRGWYQIALGQLDATVSIVLVSPGGTQILTSISSASGEVTSWTKFAAPASPVPAGKSVTLRIFTPQADGLTAEFYFDALALNATVCR
jgi:hypothetical protein